MASGAPGVGLPPVRIHHSSCAQRPQQTSDAEDGDDEGPDEGELPWLQGKAVPLSTCAIHQLLNELATSTEYASHKYIT